MSEHVARQSETARYGGRRKKWVCPKVALWHLSGHWPVASLFLATSGLSACSSGRCTEMHHHHHHCSRCNSTIHSVVKLHLCVMHIHCCVLHYIFLANDTHFTVQRLWVERSSVIKFGISSAGRPQPSDQQSNPYKSQSEPFLGQIHHLHFLNQTQYSGAQKASTFGRIASSKVFADMDSVCKEIKFLADYPHLNSCHLHIKRWLFC